MKEDAKSRRRTGDGADPDRTTGASAVRGSSSRGQAPLVDEPAPIQAMVAYVADEIAMAAMATRGAAAPADGHCDACGASIEGEPGGRGLLYWARGDELRFDEPPLCDSCAVAVTASANRQWDIEDEEG